MNEWETTLVAEAKRGNSQCFEELYALYHKKVFAVIRATVKNSADAEDILQLTFLSAWRGLKNLSSPSAFNTWIQRIAINHCYELLRKKNVVILLDSEDEVEQIAEGASDELIPAVYAEREDLRLRLGGILEGLSEVQRQTVTLFYFNELKVEEIADVMDCNAGTVKTRLFLARKTIRSEIEEQERKTGQKFYGVAGIPMFPLAHVLAGQMESASLTSAVSSGIWENISSAIIREAVAGAHAAAGTASAASSGGAAAGAAAKAGIPLIVKIIAGIAAAVAVTAGVATWVNHNRSAADSPPVPTVSSSPQPSEQPSATPTVSEQPAEKDYLALYAPVLDEFRRVVRGESEESSLAIIFHEVLAKQVFTEIDFGYALKDLNGNGTQELVLLSRSLESQAIAVYSLVDDTPVMLTSSMARVIVNIRADGTILRFSFGGLENEIYNSYGVSGDDSALDFIEGYQSVRDDSQGITVYSYHTTDPTDPSAPQSEATGITAEEYAGQTDSVFPYTYEDAGLQFIPLFDTAPADSGAATQAGAFTPLEANVPVEVDLDGDGNMDTVCVTVEYDEYGWSESISVTTNGTSIAVVPVETDTESEYSYSESYMCAYMYRAPDGTYGVLVSSWFDAHHNDTLRLFRYDGTQPVKTHEEFGTIVSVSGDTLQCQTTVDTLGGWFADCEYVIAPDFRIALKEGTLYTNLTSAYSGSESSAIVPAQEIPVEWYRNGAWEAGVLLPGEAITPYETDGERFVYCHDSQGVGCRVAFERRDGYGIYVNGISEFDVFPNLPYYDG